MWVSGESSSGESSSISSDGCRIGLLDSPKTRIRKSRIRRVAYTRFGQAAWFIGLRCGSSAVGQRSGVRLSPRTGSMSGRGPIFFSPLRPTPDFPDLFFPTPHSSQTVLASDCISPAVRDEKKKIKNGKQSLTNVVQLRAPVVPHLLYLISDAFLPWLGSE